MSLGSSIRDTVALFYIIFRYISCPRYVAALEDALRALALHLLLHIVLRDRNVIKKCIAGSDILQEGSLEGGEGGVLGSANEGSERVVLLREHADDLLVREQCDAWVDF